MYEREREQCQGPPTPSLEDGGEGCPGARTMTKRRLAAYIDALADGKHPDSFDADPDDVDVLRTAISLRSARPGDSLPDDGFVNRLYEELANEADPQVV